MRTFSCLVLCSYNTFLSLKSIKQFSHPVKLKIALFTLDNSQKKIFATFFVSLNHVRWKRFRQMIPSLRIIALFFSFAYSHWLKTLCWIVFLLDGHRTLSSLLGFPSHLLLSLFLWLPVASLFLHSLWSLYSFYLLYSVYCLYSLYSSSLSPGPMIPLSSCTPTTSLTLFTSFTSLSLRRSQRSKRVKGVKGVQGDREVIGYGDSEEE